MVTLEQVAAFGVAALILIAIPGPSVLFVVGRALAHGRRTALASVVGNACGVYVVAVFVALGVGTVVATSATVFTLVKLCGAAYLVWLGLQAIRKRGSLTASTTEMPGETAHVPGDWRAVRQGFLVGVANPKAFIIFASVLPQFVDAEAGHVPLQMLELSIVAFVVALVCDSCWGLAAATVRAWFARSPRRTALVGAAGGASMIGLGLTLAVTGRPRD